MRFFAKALRVMLKNKKTIVAPGVFDGLSALVTKQAGFPLLYASGGAIARSMGVPDIGLVTLTQMAARLREIVRVTEMPVIADADTGFGNAANTQLTVQEYEQAGVAGLHIEDQDFPKRCGHLDGKTLIPIDEMSHKIRVAKAAVTDPDFLIIARTDAIGTENFDSAINRALAYQKAGADMIFVEAPETIEQIEKIAQLIPGPKLINMFHGGKTPMVSTKVLEELGYNIIIIPSDLQRAAIKAMQDTLAAIQRDGNSMAVAKLLASFKKREEIVQTDKYLKL